MSMDKVDQVTLSILVNNLYWIAEEMNVYLTKAAFFNTLEGKTICYHAYNSSIFKEGEVVGKLWGGNLSTLCALCGTNFIPNEDLILFLEDLNEPVYKIDKMF